MEMLPEVRCGERGGEVALEEMGTEISIFLEKDFLEFLFDRVCRRQLN